MAELGCLASKPLHTRGDKSQAFLFERNNDNHNSHFLDNNSLSHTRTTKRVSFHVTDRVSLVILFARPSLFLSDISQFATCAKTTWLAILQTKKTRKEKNPTTEPILTKYNRSIMTGALPFTHCLIVWGNKLKTMNGMLFPFVFVLPPQFLSWLTLILSLDS